MNEPNPKLLRDLAQLVAKYRPKDWEQLADWLNDNDQRERLRTLLQDLASASAGARKKSRRRPKRSATPVTGLRNALGRVRREDAAKADLLDDIWLKLRERELLPTIAAVRAFAQAMGSKGLKATRRDQAVTELMELLIALPPDALEERMRQTVVADRKLGEEYEEWVRLILGRARDVEPPQ
jgi:hypothetical protein